MLEDDLRSREREYAQASELLADPARCENVRQYRTLMASAKDCQAKLRLAKRLFDKHQRIHQTVH
jgi:hypothetical protein